jgi:hypothetical protein
LDVLGQFLQLGLGQEREQLGGGMDRKMVAPIEGRFL